MLPEQDRRRFKTIQLILGIVEVLLALWIFRQPEGTMMVFAIILGLLLVFRGILAIAARNWLKDNFNLRSNGLVVIGVIDILLGLLICFNIRSTASFLPTLFALYMLVHSCLSLFTMSPMRMLVPGYFGLSSVVSILTLLLSLQLLMVPGLSQYFVSFIVGVYLLLKGIENIVYGFLD